MKKNYLGLAWLAALAFFMQTLDATILNTALPAVAQSLHESPLNMQLAVISYALSVALFIPLSAWLADGFGTLNVFRFSLSVFVLGSVGCAMATDLNTLVLFRIIQGFGGALMTPVVRLTMLQAIPKNQLIHAWNLAAVAGLLGPILGPILGGWLVTYATWHWIFLINIPIGLAGIAYASWQMPNFRKQRGKLDFLGFGLFASGLVGITLGLDLINNQHVAWGWSVALFCLGVSGFALYVRHAKHHSTPLLSLQVFRVRTFHLGLLSNLALRLCGSSVPFLLPLLFQLQFHFSPDKVGWLLAPIALSSIFTKSFVTPLLRHLGYRHTLMLSAVGILGAVASMAWLNEHSSLWTMVILFAIYGTFMSILFTAINTLTISDLDEQHLSSGSTLLSVTQQLGIGLGIAVASMLLSLYHHAFQLQNAPLQSAFNATFITCAAFGLLLLWLSSRLKPTDGAHLVK